MTAARRLDQPWYWGLAPVVSRADHPYAGELSAGALVWSAPHAWSLVHRLHQLWLGMNLSASLLSSILGKREMGEILRSSRKSPIDFLWSLSKLPRGYSPDYNRNCLGTKGALIGRIRLGRWPSLTYPVLHNGANTSSCGVYDLAWRLDTVL